MHSVATLLQLVYLLLSSLHLNPCSGAAAASNFSCLVSNGVSNFSLPTSPSYAGQLNSSIFNLRFTLRNVAGPAAVVFPESRDDLRRAILCARASSLAIRVRSGGYSYEGLSYTTENHVAFVVVYLANLNRVRVDPGSATAWAESGATVGELYYTVGRSSKSLAFPAGSESTTGLGATSPAAGSGFCPGSLRSPPTTCWTRCSSVRTAESLTGARWATTCSGPSEAAEAGAGVWCTAGSSGSFRFLATLPCSRSVGPVRSNTLPGWFTGGNMLGPIYRMSFISRCMLLPDRRMVTSPSRSRGQVLESKLHALSVLSQSFPELGLTELDLSEMSWVESTAKFAGLSTVEDMANRRRQAKHYSKSKSDYVQAPITRRDMVEIVRWLSTGPTGSIQLDPYGGAMARVGRAETPFPHRAGNLYSIQYGVNWDQSQVARAEEYIGWLRSFYKYMNPYVSKDPRAAYVNYLDLDLGANNWTRAAGGSSAQAVARVRSSWGEAYFGLNFDRLVRAKTVVDPGNVFNNAQSIPSMHP